MIMQAVWTARSERRRLLHPLIIRLVKVIESYVAMPRREGGSSCYSNYGRPKLPSQRIALLAENSEIPESLTVGIIILKDSYGIIRCSFNLIVVPLWNIDPI